MDYGGIVKLSFAWINHKRESAKYVLLFYLLSILFFVGLAGIGLVFFQNLITLALAGNTAALLSAVQSPSIIPAFSGFLLVAVFWSLVYGLAVTFVSVLVYLFALRSRNLPAAPVNTIKVLKYILLGVVAEFAALLCVFNLKFLLVLFAAIILSAIALFSVLISPIVAALFGIFAFLAFFAFLIIVVYNSIRLGLAPIVFLSRNVKISTALKESWVITRGKVLEIILASVVGGIAIYVLFYVASLIFSIFTTILVFVSGIVYLQIGLNLLFSMLISPLQIFSFAFLSIAIYAEVIASPSKK